MHSIDGLKGPCVSIGILHAYHYRIMHAIMQRMEARENIIT